MYSEEAKNKLKRFFLKAQGWSLAQKWVKLGSGEKPVYH